MHRCSARYLLISENYSAHPIDVVYRGQSGQLHKRDFAGEILEAFPDVSLVDYGFTYHRDPRWFPQEDVTWFLMEKR